MDSEQIFRRFMLFLTTYLATVTTVLLLTGTIGVVNNGNILTDGTDKRKYLEEKYNELR